MHSHGSQEPFAMYAPSRVNRFDSLKRQTSWHPNSKRVTTRALIQQQEQDQRDVVPLRCLPHTNSRVCSSNISNAAKAAVRRVDSDRHAAPCDQRSRYYTNDSQESDGIQSLQKLCKRRRRCIHTPQKPWRQPNCCPIPEHLSLSFTFDHYYWIHDWRRRESWQKPCANDSSQLSIVTAALMRCA